MTMKKNREELPNIGIVETILIKPSPLPKKSIFSFA